MLLLRPFPSSLQGRSVWFLTLYLLNKKKHLWNRALSLKTTRLPWIIWKRGILCFLSILRVVIIICLFFLQPSWDSTFPLPSSVIEELIFWKENIRVLEWEAHWSTASRFTYCGLFLCERCSCRGRLFKDRDGVICLLPWSSDQADRSLAWALRGPHLSF